MGAVVVRCSGLPKIVPRNPCAETPAPPPLAGSERVPLTMASWAAAASPSAPFRFRRPLVEAVRVAIHSLRSGLAVRSRSR